MPGSISVVRMPVSLRSARTASPIAVTAHFVTEYSDPGMRAGLRPSR